MASVASRHPRQTAGRLAPSGRGAARSAARGHTPYHLPRKRRLMETLKEVSARRHSLRAYASLLPPRLACPAYRLHHRPKVLLDFPRLDA